MNMLSAWAFAPIVIAAQMSGWTCGRLIRKRLPAEHLAPTTCDAVVLAVGMVATLPALVLGLMISTAITKLQTLILALSPADNGQRWLQTRALNLSAELERARVLMAERSDGSIPVAFLIVLVAWLAMLYLALAIFAPANATATAAALGGSLAFAAAIFLILELDRPFHGVVRISTDSLVGTSQLLGR